MQLHSVRKTLAVALAASTLLAVSATGQIITQWNFNNITPGDLDTATTSFGSGSIVLLGGVTHPTGGSSGAGSSDTALPNTAFQTTTYPAQSTASGTAGVRFNADTTGPIAIGITGVEITFDLRLSNTSSRWYRLDYTVDGGSNWTLGSPTRLGTEPNAGDQWFNQNSVVINDLGTLNNPGFGFRIVSVFSPVAFTQQSGSIFYEANSAYEVARNNGQSAYAGGGTWRFDMVTVSAIPEPSTYAALFGGCVLLLVVARRFRRRG